MASTAVRFWHLFIFQAKHIAESIGNINPTKARQEKEFRYEILAQARRHMVTDLTQGVIKDQLSEMTLIYSLTELSV